jgi:hypothetical protein
MVGFETQKRRSRTANPGTQKRQKRKRNTDLITLGLINPGGKKVASKKKTSSTHKPKAQKRKPNPQPQKKRSGKRVHNPNAITGRTVQIIKQGALALAGLVATRQLPQLVLADKNTSWMGYLANLAVALGSATLANAFMKGAGVPVAIGGGLYIVDRVLTEQFSSAGQILSLSGVGDFKVAVNGARGLQGIRQGYFPLPVQYDAGGNPIIPQAILAAAQRGMAPAAAAGAAGAGSGMAGIRGPNRVNGNRLVAA